MVNTAGKDDDGVAAYTGKAHESAVGGVSLLALWGIEKSGKTSEGETNWVLVVKGRGSHVTTTMWL